MTTDTEIDANRGARFVFRQPLLIGESHEETALAYGRVSYQEQLAVDNRVWAGHREDEEMVVYEQTLSAPSLRGVLPGFVACTC